MKRAFLFGFLLTTALATFMGCGENQSADELSTNTSVSAAATQSQAPSAPTVSDVQLISSPPLTSESQQDFIAVFTITNPNPDVALWQAELNVVAKDSAGKVLAVNKGALGHAQDTIPLVPPNTTWTFTNSNIALSGLSQADFARINKVDVTVGPRWKIYDAKKMGLLTVNGANIVSGSVLGQVTDNLDVSARQVLFYAIVSKDGKIVGAGRDSIYDLRPGQTQSFEFRVTGETTGELQLLALPLDR